MTKSPRVGLYLEPETIVRNPGYLEALCDQIGLNLVILTFSGELPQEVLAYSPFDSAPPSPARVRELISYHLDGEPCTTDLEVALHSVGPHVAISSPQAQANLRQALEMCQAAGLDVWLLAGMYTAHESLMFCPGNEENNRWYESYYTHLATAYGVQGIDITHARYPKTSLPRGIFLCGCRHCSQAAQELGYDMAAMRADITHALASIKQLTPVQLTTLASSALGPLDALHLNGLRPGVIDWFRFRADLIARNLKRFHRAVHEAAGPDFIFGIDTYPASTSLFAGQDQTRWGDFADFASPLLSHVENFPMRSFVAWAKGFQQWLPQLSEAEALQLAYRMTGYGELNLPDTIADFALGEPDCEYRHIPLRELVRLDMAKAKLYLPQGLPAYPIIQGGGAPRAWPLSIVQQLMADALDLGYDGYIFQGTSVLMIRFEIMNTFQEQFQDQTEYSNVTFSKVKLEAGRVIGKEFDACVFSQCSLRESIFRDCKFMDCTFQGGDLSLVRFEGSSFSETSFEKSTVIGVNWTLAAWSKFQSDAPVAFTECVIDYSAFIGLTLRKLKIQKCSAKEVEFSDADLTAANFSGTDLSKSRFNQTNLTKANFEGAINYSINITANKVTKAKFSLPEALSLLYGLDIVLVD